MLKTFLALFCLITSTLFAQQKKLQQYIGWRGNEVELNTVSNKQHSCTFVKDLDSLKAFVFDLNGELTNEFTVALHPREIFRGAFIKGDSVFLFLHNEKMHGFHSWVFNLSNKSVSESAVEFALKKSDKQVHRLYSDNYYFYLTVNKKTKEFIVYRFTDGSHYDTFSYPITDAVFYAITTQDLFSETFNVEKVDAEGECDVAIAQSQNKLYIRNDTLYLAIDSNYKTTDLYIFDLINKNTTFRSIDHKINMPADMSYSCNSYLEDGKLYYVLANDDNLWVQIIDFYSGEILKQYKVGSHEEIGFKNTPITQESETVFNIPTNRELSKTKQLVRKMLNGTAVIMATPDSSFDHTIITIGSYKKMATANGGGGGVFMPMGVGAVPIFVPTGGFSMHTWVRSAHFKMLVDNETNEQMPGDLTTIVNDRIDRYSANIKTPDEGQNLFRHGKNYFYAYYDKDKRSFVVVEF